uniref:Uncharacterized protein n=1 Tax=Arundo donax TaxID=35708 RepID=A0A0A8ZZ49_ARUDO
MTPKTVSATASSTNKKAEKIRSIRAKNNPYNFTKLKSIKTAREKLPVSRSVPSSCLILQRAQFNSDHSPHILNSTQELTPTSKLSKDGHEGRRKHAQGS